MIGALMGLPGKLKTLLDRLTATRAGLLDNLDAAVTTRAPASTAVSNIDYTATRAGYLDSVLRIKNNYTGTITISTGASNYATLPFTPVDLKTILIKQGHAYAQYVPGSTSYAIEGVRIRRAGNLVYAELSQAMDGLTSSIVVNYQVVEFY